MSLQLISSLVAPIDYVDITATQVKSRASIKLGSCYRISDQFSLLP